ncbi:hypothetical protein [Leeuwenhoekiella marinoflava]|uniref:hypothetical protein n=1 Tax=Leeuwenhoekiella marinoflava TaxID=988 RepID=UPI00300308E2
MIKDSTIILFHYHYQLSDSELEKHILEHWALDNEISKSHITTDICEFNINDILFQEHFEFLYGIYSFVNENYYVEPNLYSALKNFSLRSSFFNSQLKELHRLLLEKVKQGKTLDQVMVEIKI